MSSSNKKGKKQHKYLTKRGYIVDKEEIGPKEYKKLVKDLTVKPSLNSDFGAVAESFPLFIEKGNSICIPRYYGVEKFGKPKKTIGLDPVKVDFKFKGSLRDLQKPIVEKAISTLKETGGGILQLYCGCGKTVLALKIAAELGLKTLIIVHKTFLQNQWIERAKEFTDAKIGIIRQKKTDVKGKDIVIGMLQSISMIDYDLSIFDDFQLVICDEVHHFASRVFSKALYKVGSKYTLGLSATPHRSDGLTKVLFWYLGDIMYKLERNGDKGVVVKAFNYHTVDKLYKEQKRWVKGKGMKPNMPIMLNNLVKIDNRNTLIIKLLKALVSKDERKILVLSDRIGHLKAMKKLLDTEIAGMIKQGDIEEDELKTSFYIGEMKEYERKDAADGDVIFASYAMAAEGLDIPSLNTLIFATPKKNIIQCVGRILRKQIKEADINPLIIDILDNYSIFEAHGKKRLEYYDKKKYTVEMYNAIEDSVSSKKDYIIQVHGEEFYDLVKDDIDDYDTDLSKLMDCDVVITNTVEDSDSESEDEEFDSKGGCMFVD